MTRRTMSIGAALIVAILAVGVVGYLSLRSDGSAATSATAQAPRYHCPMHPTMVSDRPDDCPICGMRMVPIEESEGAPHTAVHGVVPPEHDPPAAKDAATPKAEHGQPGAAPGAQKKIIYRSTMNPNEMSDQPGKDSMGMDMVPEEIDASPAGSTAAVEGRVAVKVSTQKRQLIGVRTAPVEKGPFTRTIRTVGRVTYDESRLRNVFTKVSGWVERLYANTTGQLVKEGEPLLSIYSPDLVSSAQEYLLALRGRDQLADSDMAGDSSDRLVESARRRLLLFGLTPQQITALQKTGEAPTTMTLHAPISGNIITRYVTQGDRIEPGTKLLDIAELSRVWVLADIYEYELPFVRLGQVATMTLSYLPGRTFEGRITFIYPTLSEATRTVKVRLEFSNPDFALKPEMYAQVEIRSDLGERLSVPESAVISTGTRDIAFVDRGEGYFEPRELKVGMRLADRFEVLDGVAEGEQVLTSGNFLVDSESKLKAALAAAGTEKAGSTAGHTH
ncbi:MAG TPA: efflux RND transporter periplasmic adaptor subunit [Candidatus Binatia bacterium]|jgi:multidrug efflux pump subunit AcrA (membrane-fusion protein)